MTTIPAIVTGGHAGEITLADHRLAAKLGVVLFRSTPCHGYANDCGCPSCQDRTDRYTALFANGFAPAKAAALAANDSDRARLRAAA